MSILFRKNVTLTSILFLLVASPYLNAHNVLIIQGSSKSFEVITKAITAELETEINLSIHKLDASSPVKDFKKSITQHKPSTLILIGNGPVIQFVRYSKKVKNPPKAIAAGALYLAEISSKTQNISGISYEVPAVTSFIQLRSILKQPLKKVGVIHRRWMRDFVEYNRAFSIKEGIDIISYEVPNKSKRFDQKIRSGLQHLISKNVDALWILNDNVLLDEKAINFGWLKNSKKIKIPIIVGVESLLAPSLNFGALATLPDYGALGLQAAEMFLDFYENGWPATGSVIEQPVSVRKMINKSYFDDHNISINREAIEHIDEVLYK